MRIKIELVENGKFLTMLDVDLLQWIQMQSLYNGGFVIRPGAVIRSTAEIESRHGCNSRVQETQVVPVTEE